VPSGPDLAGHEVAQVLVTKAEIFRILPKLKDHLDL
jgi:hypothetical protein